MTDVALIRYDAACKALAEAVAVDEVQKIRVSADALRAYARQAKNRQLEADAGEIRIRAERRLGQLISAQKATVGLARGTRGQLKGRDSSGGTVMEPPEVGPLGPPEVTLAEAGIDKKLSARAQKLAAVPEPAFEVMVEDWRDRVRQETERVTTNLLREGERQQKREERVAPVLPSGRFRLLYVDPPWRYEHVETESRAIENQYPTMSLDAICALSVPAADDAVLFLWATSPKLAEAMKVVEAWNFTYRTCAVWDKEVIGMGYYFRQQHELLLVAARGSLPVPAESTRKSSVFRARRGKHSEKPEVVYAVLEQMYPAFTEIDRVEMFSRKPRPGWSSWGNEPAVVAS